MGQKGQSLGSKWEECSKPKIKMKEIKKAKVQKNG